MSKTIFIFYSLIFVCSLCSCKNKKTTKNSLRNIYEINHQLVNKEESHKKIKNIKKDTLHIYAIIDTVSINEIKNGSYESSLYIFDYYSYEKHPYDDFDNWSEKMFGKCCTETDLTYAEMFKFKAESNIDNKKHPDLNMCDTKYNTAYAFKESQNPKINISLNFEEDISYFIADEKKYPVNLLKSNDTILSPFKLSLINGYVKSSKTFVENGRVKTFEVFHNKSLVGIVELLDTPNIQQFTLKDVVFYKNDIITLIPKSYYKGTKYDDVCISEIQSNLGYIAHPSINKKYQVFD